MNIVVFLGGLLMLTMGFKGSLMCRISKENIKPCLFGANILFFALIYFVLIRKNYSWYLGLIFSALLVPVHLMFIVAAAANPFILHMMKKVDDSMKGDAGYPGFAQLVTSYIYDEDPAEDGVMDEAGEKSEPENSFDKYRIKPENDRGMLADQDIFDE